MYRRIGSTTYKVRIHFSDTAQESMEDKIIRLIGSETMDMAPECGIMMLPQMSRQPEKTTALYERLSRDDEAAGDSNSIVNQKLQLESYAAQHGFTNCIHYTDDGWSGGNFERPDWKRLIVDIEAGKVGCVIAKDMSRIGRDYLQTGFYTDV